VATFSRACSSPSLFLTLVRRPGTRPGTAAWLSCFHFRLIFLVYAPFPPLVAGILGSRFVFSVRVPLVCASPSSVGLVAGFRWLDLHRHPSQICSPGSSPFFSLIPRPRFCFLLSSFQVTVTTPLFFLSVPASPPGRINRPQVAALSLPSGFFSLIVLSTGAADVAGSSLPKSLPSLAELARPNTTGLSPLSATSISAGEPLDSTTTPPRAIVPLSSVLFSFPTVSFSADVFYL